MAKKDFEREDVCIPRSISEQVAYLEHLCSVEETSMRMSNSCKVCAIRQSFGPTCLVCLKRQIYRLKNERDRAFTRSERNLESIPCE